MTTTHRYTRETLAEVFSGTAAAVAAGELPPSGAVHSVIAVLHEQEVPMVAEQLAAHWSHVDQSGDPVMVAVQARMLIASTALALAL